MIRFFKLAVGPNVYPITSDSADWNKSHQVASELSLLLLSTALGDLELEPKPMQMFMEISRLDLAT